MSNELEDWQLALLVEARGLKNPTLVESEEAEALRDAERFLDQAEDKENPVVVEHEVKKSYEKNEALREAAQGIDDWEVVESDEWEAVQEACDAAGDAFSEALKENHDLRDEVVESMSLPAMVSQFKDEDEEHISLDSLAQHPTTGGQDEDPVAEPDDPDDDEPETLSDALDALDASERNKAREELQIADRMSDRAPKFSENKRIEVLNDILGLDDSEFDPEDLTVEAL